MKVPSCISNNSGGKYPHQPSPDGPTKRWLPQNDWRNYSFNCQSEFQWDVTQLIPEVSQFCWQTEISKSSVQVYNPNPLLVSLVFSNFLDPTVTFCDPLCLCGPTMPMLLCLNHRTSPALEKWIPAPGNVGNTSGNTYHLVPQYLTRIQHNWQPITPLVTRTATCHPGWLHKQTESAILGKTWHFTTAPLTTHVHTSRLR